MYQRALTIYYSLAIFVLGTAFFVLQPSQVPEVTAFQQNIVHQFNVAWQQTIGDQPWFDDLALVYNSIADFYDQSSKQTIALLNQPQTDEDIIYVFQQVYSKFAQVLDPNHQPHTHIATAAIDLPAVPSRFMTEKPIYNLVPDNHDYSTSVSVATNSKPEVAGVVTINDQPVNSIDHPWVTIQDNMTGQLYCLAVYNGAVNKYLGACKYDYH